MKQKVLIIVGPTASGKSSLGVELAKKFNGEIISADSRQVYRGLDIGTGKITKHQMHGVRHHLLDIASPKRAFTADQYVTKAERAIQDISKRGKLPIIVGGTGFYIDALVGRISIPNVPPDPAFRKRLNTHAAASLLRLLQKLDPRRAKKIAASPSERNNRVRMIRALEIARALGKVPSSGTRANSYDALWIGIAPPDAHLKKRIHARLDARLKEGMIAEAKRLHKAGLSFKRMRELGLEYRSLAHLLQRRIDLDRFRAELQSDIWRYARKQIGYWRRNANIKWFKPTDSAKIRKEIVSWL